MIISPAMLEEGAAIIWKLIQVGPEVYDTLSKVVPIAEKLFQKIASGEPVTDDEWAALHDEIDAQEAEFQTPMSDEQ
jgi:hypothetical protein